MKKTSILVAFVVTVMMMFTSSTAQAAEKKVGMLPFVTDEFPQLTKQQYLDFLINSKIESSWKFYVTGFKSHTTEYAELAKQQVKARIQILTGSSDKMSDQELIDFINNKCEIAPVGTKEVVNSTATKIDSATGKVLGHATAKQRIGARVNKITKAVEQKLIVEATGDVVSYLSCVNTGTDDPTEVALNGDEGGNDEKPKTLDEVKKIQEKQLSELKVIKTPEGITIINSPINYNYVGGATATVTAPAATVVEKTKKPAWDHDDVDYSNKYTEEVTYIKKPKKIVYEEEEVVYAKKPCYNCDNTETNAKLDKITKQNKGTLAGVWIGNGIQVGRWIYDAITGRRIGSQGFSGGGFGGDGGFVDVGSLNQQGGFGGDGGFVIP